MMASMFSKVPEGPFLIFAEEERSEFEDLERPLKSSGRVLCHLRSGENVV